MNRQQFLSFMQSPDKLNGESVALLADVVRQFPYCQTAQLLYLKNLHLHKSIHYNNQLKIAATYSSDRKKLYELVIQPGITSKIQKIEGSTLEHSDLEREILKEAINASIQLEVAQSKPKTRTPAKNETASPKKPSRTTGKSNIQKGERTFGEWLKRINKEGQKSRVKPTIQTADKLIGVFLKENPQVTSSKGEFVGGLSTPLRGGAEFFSPVNAARLSIIEDENFITETLAKIHVKQKNYTKGIKDYETLILQNPEKSSIFAARIEHIQKLINKEKAK